MQRILALDFGVKRVGLAIGDPETAIITPVATYHRRNDELDARHFRAVCEDHGIARLVVGLPVSNGGVEGPSAQRARGWGEWLAAAVGLPLTFFDERYTSVEADESMRTRGLKASERRQRVDSMAARILLQDFLAAGCPSDGGSASPLEDAGP